MNKTLALVVAGNYRQYHHWLQVNSFKRENYKYIRYPFHLYGYYNIPIYCVGTYWLNPIYKEILDLPTKNIRYEREK